MSIPSIHHRIILYQMPGHNDQHFFQKLPMELFLKILSHLTLGDLQNIARLDKWAFTQLLYADLPCVIKEILFCYRRRDLTKQILSTQIRDYFILNTAPILSLRADQITKLYDQCFNKLNEHKILDLSERECVKICKSKSSYLIEQLISSERFKRLNPRTLTEMFQILANSGPISSFRAIIRSERFNDINICAVNQTFCLSNCLTHRETIQTLMLSPLYTKLSIEAISTALLNASIQGDADTIFYLISSERFKNVPSEIMGHAVELTCKFGHYDALKTILASKFSKYIPHTKITASFIEAEKRDNKAILDMLRLKYPEQQIERSCTIC